jgi:hypothetical protein
MKKKSNSIQINNLNQGRASLLQKMKKILIKEKTAEVILIVFLMMRNSNRI